MAVTKQQKNPGFKVMTGAFTMPLDAESKRVQRYLKGDVVYPDPEFVDVEHLVALKALAPEGDDKVEVPTPAQLAQSSREANGEPSNEPKTDNEAPKSSS